MKILGIETSCDETGVAVYDSDQGMLSNALFSQVKIHAGFGGVIPEIASRSQLEKINSITQEALEKAQLKLDAIDAIAVTYKPGLPGSLLVGLCFAKALAYAKNIPLVGVNHLEGHVFSSQIENNIPFPYITLTASGGHTALYYVQDLGNYQTIGQTLDDAAGEAFDKIAKLIDLPYPGGPIIEKLAAQANFEDFFHYPRTNLKSLDFSFSGLKTAVLYDLVNRGAYDMRAKTFLKKGDEIFQMQVASSLLVCIADVFCRYLAKALENYPDAKALSFVGGVACNKYIHQRIQEIAHKHGLTLYSPSPQYCTDNGGMIAFVGNYKTQKGEFSPLSLDLY